MADFLVLRIWKGALPSTTPGASGVVTLQAGAVISDRTYDVAQLSASGLRVIAVSAALEALLEQGDRGLGDVVAAAVQNLYSAAPGSGDVVGPAGATDNALARYNLATGKLIQNSLVLVDDAGNLTLPALRTVDGRDVSVDGAVLDAHVANVANPHAVTAAQTGGDAAGTPRPPTVGELVMFGASSIFATTVTRYLYPGYSDNSADNTVIQIAMPRAGTLKNLFIRASGTAGNGNDVVYTLRVNEAPSALAVTLASDVAQASDTSSNVVVAQGDRVDIEVTKAASIGSSPSDLLATLEYAA